MVHLDLWIITIQVVIFEGFFFISDASKRPLFESKFPGPVDLQNKFPQVNSTI